MLFPDFSIHDPESDAMDLKKTEQLARFIHYLTGRHPDEFGLVTDPQGFIPTADVLKALHEEGWQAVRRHHLESLSYHLRAPVLEIQGHLMRAADRSRLDGFRETADCPKLLYTPVRRRAYETVREYGLRPHGHTGRVVLLATQDLALRVGRRRDAEPVIVKVHVQNARRRGHGFQQFGHRVFLTVEVPPDCCRLPRIPKSLQRREQERTAVASPPSPPPTPGSFTVDMERLAHTPTPGKADGPKPGSKDWKRERRKARRWKERRHKPGK